MPAPYKKIFEFKGKQLTSVVIDEADFMALADELGGIRNLHDNIPTKQEDIDRIKAARHIPMFGRGTKTEWIFDRFDITTDWAAIIVRGAASQVFNTLFD